MYDKICILGRSLQTLHMTPLTNETITVHTFIDYRNVVLPKDIAETQTYKFLYPVAANVSDVIREIVNTLEPLEFVVHEDHISRKPGYTIIQVQDFDDYFAAVSAKDFEHAGSLTESVYISYYDIPDTISRDVNWIFEPNTDRGGGGDILSSLAEVAALVLFLERVVEIFRSRGSNKDLGPVRIQDNQSGQRLREIGVIMADGQWVRLSRWIYQPDALLTFVKEFSRSGSSNVPKKVCFTFEDGNQFNFNLHSDQDMKNLTSFIRKLDLI